jgi:septum formation protein
MEAKTPRLSMADFIYLASQSPRRRQLLEQIGVAYRLLPAGDDEDAEGLEAVLPGEAPATYVARVTRLKLDAACRRLQQRKLPAAPVLCADTTVALGRVIFGKPADDGDAARMLGALSGRTHRVLTAVAVQAGARRWEALSESRVGVAALTGRQIEAYVRTGEARGKAGAYGVQGEMARHIARISGSYSGIMGLPLFETANLLAAAGFETEAANM